MDSDGISMETRICQNSNREGGSEKESTDPSTHQCLNSAFTQNDDIKKNN